MKITTEEALSRLAKNPQAAAQFDACSPGLTRRENVQKTIAAIDAAIAENAALKAKVSATKAKLAALESAKLSQSNFMKNAVTTPPTQATQTTTAPAAKLTTAEDYQRSIAPPTMKRTEFSKLTPIQRNQWIRDGGKLV